MDEGTLSRRNCKKKSLSHHSSQSEIFEQNQTHRTTVPTRIMETTTTTEHSSLNKKILIVGGGPSGAATAKAMGDRGYKNIHLYEAYPHPKTLSKTSSKSYVIALNLRGQNGIRASTGIDLIAEASDPSNTIRGVVSYDMARHNTNRKNNQTSARCRNHKDTPSLIIPRKALTERLLEAAEKSGVTVHYRHRLQDVDFDGKVATFTDSSGAIVKVDYDLLLGADGCNSRVRKSMSDNQTSLKDFSVRTEEDSMEYQVVVLPRNPFETSHPNGTVHTWNNPEFNAICLGFPIQPTKDNKHQSLLLAMVFPEGNLESFGKAEDGYRAPLQKLLPDLFDKNNNSNNTDAEENLRIVEEQLRANQIANGGLCVWSSSLGQAVTDPITGQTTSGVIILGDAAHGMWPSLGQGANCALESIEVFVNCLDDMLSSADTPTNKTVNNNSWIAGLIQAYNDARLDDARAAVDLTYGGIGARKSRGRQNAPITFKLQVAGMMVLHKLTLGVVPMPALLQVLLGSNNVSYQKLKKFNFCYEKYICLGALAIFTTLIAAWRNVLPVSFSGIAGSDL